MADLSDHDLDDSSLRPLHWAAIAIVSVGFLFDGFDFQATAFAAPLIKVEWGLNPKALGGLISAGFLGLFFGSMIAGYLADIVGRKRAFAGCIFVYTVFTALAAIVHDLPSFIILRFLTGLGLGGLIPIGVAWLMEFLPERRRTAIVAAVISCFLGGWILASVSALVVIPHFGWRAFFALGATPVILAFILAFWGPESPSWLFAHGRTDEALAVLAKAGHRPPSRQALAQMETAPRTNWLTLFSGQHVKASLIIGAMYFLIATVSAGITQWLPSVLIDHGISMQNTFIYFLVVSMGPMIGTIVMGLLLDVWGRRRSFIIFWIGASVFIVLFACITSPAGVMVFGFGLTSCTVATFSCLDVITAEIYPVELRASAIGFGMGLSRLGGAFGPLLGGYLAAANVGYTVFFLVFAVPPLINAILALKLKFRDEDGTPRKLQVPARSQAR